MAISVTPQSAPGRSRPHEKYERLVAAANSISKLKVSVAHPCDGPSLGAVFEAADLGLIAPILVGPRDKIEAAKALQRDLTQVLAT